MGKTETQYLIEWLEKQNQINNELIIKLKRNQYQSDCIKILSNSVKKYRISQLALIVGCSEVAIRKKIKTIGDTKMYRGKYKVIMDWYENRKIAFILMSDEDIEREKRQVKISKSKIYSSVKTAYNTHI